MQDSLTRLKRWMDMRRAGYTGAILMKRTGMKLYEAKELALKLGVDMGSLANSKR